MLVAEDDEGLGEVLARGLREQGYVVDLVPDGEAAAAYLRFYQYEVAVVDWRMPRLSGLDLVQRLRRNGTATPVLMLTARDTPADRITGLDAGADDYLVKPFGLSELQARIRAVLRRIRPGSDLVRHGPLTVDLRTHKVTVDGQDVALTPKEFDILDCLAADPGRVRTRQEILEAAWDAHWYGPTKVLDVHVAALRRKLGVPGLIETVYGRGFRLGDLDGP